MADHSDRPPVSWLTGLTLLGVCVAWAVVDFGVGNLSDQDFVPGRLPGYFLLFFALGGAYAALIKLLFRKTGSGVALLAASVGVFLTQNYYLVAEYLEALPNIREPALIGVVSYTAALVVMTALLVWRGSRRAAPILTVAMIFGLGVVTLQNGWKLVEHLYFSDAGNAALGAAARLRSDSWPRDPERLNSNVHYRDLASERPPNIYYIIPDMFMGESEYRIMTGDGYRMDDLLRERGFEVLDNYYANAPITRFSLAHVFGGSYFADRLSSVTTKLLLTAPWRTNNAVVKGFRERGYNIHYYVDTFVNAECDGLADYCFAKRSRLHAQDLVFFERTPLFDFLAVSGDERAAVWRRLIKFPYWYEIPEVLDVLPGPGASPHFTYMHFGLPHSPYRYNGRCEYYDAYPPIRKDKYTGSVRAYRQQVECAERQYPRLIDAILANDPQAWIVFQSDHGVNFVGQSTGADILALDNQSVGENLSILGAYRLPRRCLDMIPDDMSPVNTFPVVFACLDDATPELLPARHFLMYYLSWQPDGTIREVTDIIRERARLLR